MVHPDASLSDDIVCVDECQDRHIHGTDFVWHHHRMRNTIPFLLRRHRLVVPPIDRYILNRHDNRDRRLSVGIDNVGPLQSSIRYHQNPDVR